MDIEEEDENTTLLLVVMRLCEKQIMKINRKTVVDLNCLDYNSFLEMGIVIGCLLNNDDEYRWNFRCNLSLAVC